MSWQLYGPLVVFFAAIAAASIPLVVAYIVQSYTAAVKERDRNAQYVEIAVGILSESPNDDNKPLREWAVSVINRYSDVPFTERQTQLLINEIPLNRIIIDIQPPGRPVARPPAKG